MKSRIFDNNADAKIRFIIRVIGKKGKEGVAMRNNCLTYSLHMKYLETEQMQKKVPVYN